MQSYNRKWFGGRRGFGLNNRINGRFKTFGGFRKAFKRSLGHLPRTSRGMYL